MRKQIVNQNTNRVRPPTEPTDPNLVIVGDKGGQTGISDAAPAHHLPIAAPAKPTGLLLLYHTLDRPHHPRLITPRNSAGMNTDCDRSPPYGSGPNGTPSPWPANLGLVVEVVGPVLHELAAPVEEVASLVGGFDAVAVDVGEGEFADFSGCVG